MMIKRPDSAKIFGTGTAGQSAAADSVSASLNLPVLANTFVPARCSPAAKKSSPKMIVPPQQNLVNMTCNGALQIANDVAPSDRIAPPTRSAEPSLLSAGSYRRRPPKNQARAIDGLYLFVDDQHTTRTT